MILYNQEKVQFLICHIVFSHFSIVNSWLFATNMFFGIQGTIIHMKYEWHIPQHIKSRCSLVYYGLTQEICTWMVFCQSSLWLVKVNYPSASDVIPQIQYIPRNMHTVFALLCFVVVTHWLIFPYPSGLLHWHCGNLTIAPVPAKQPWWIWINTSCEIIMNDCITTTKQSTTKPCACFLGYTVCVNILHHSQGNSDSKRNIRTLCI